MTIHHLNCGSIRARFPQTNSIIYCLLVETNAGLTLIDTGLGRRDYLNPSLLMRGFIFLMGIPAELKETAVHQVRDLGYKISDLRHIVLTHLHLDHAGGLPDFPDAKVHIYQTEYEAMLSPRTLLERGYDPSHWAHGPNWEVHGDEGLDWYGFKSIPIMPQLKPEIRLVPLPGHTRGHCGVAVATDQGWLFQCGDAASPHHPATDLHGHDPSKHTAGILPNWFAHRFLGPHAPRVRQMLQKHGDEVNAISGHDIFSFRVFSSTQGEVRSMKKGPQSV